MAFQNPDITWLTENELYSIRRWTDKTYNHNTRRYKTTPLHQALQHIYTLLQQIDYLYRNIANLERKIKRLEAQLEDNECIR